MATCQLVCIFMQHLGHLATLRLAGLVSIDHFSYLFHTCFNSKYYNTARTIYVMLSSTAKPFARAHSSRLSVQVPRGRQLVG